MPSDDDLLMPSEDPLAAKPTMAELTAMRRTYDRLQELEEKEIKRRSTPPVTMPGYRYPPRSLKSLAREIAFPEPTAQLEETSKNLGAQMVGVGKAANKAMLALMEMAMTPHRGGWIESVGWVCERCGAESMDLDIMREVPCG